MASTLSTQMLEKFTTFGDLLRFLRRRMGLTQLELSIAVGYSESQITRLEKNQRPPDIPTVETHFVEALGLEDEPEAVARLLDLAANVRREDAPSFGVCPYKGLSFFDEADADLFVGRETLTTRLVERVLVWDSQTKPRASRFLAVVGGSGSGKSSLVRAGLAPALRWEKKSADWRIHVLTPTARPLESLAGSLTNSIAETAQLMDDLAHDPRSLHLFASRETKSLRNPRWLLIIDQFEELFALCRSEDERAAFVDNLLDATSQTDGRVMAVITLRADFYPHCASYPALREALASQQEYIGAMSNAELRGAIEQPAERGHWELEPGLVDLVLHDVGHEPGALPLLSHALMETWQRRRGRTMTLSGYASSGGVRGAIAETAEEVFTDRFSHEEQQIARRIFLRLTELGDEISTGDTRRRATFNELVLRPEETEATRAVLTALADARLITLHEDAAEVAHEALIREWPTLRGWLEDNREGLRLHRQLTGAAQEWERLDRDPDRLYRGARLAQSREWAAAHDADLNTLEQQFLDASAGWSQREAAEREAQRERELEAARALAEEKTLAAGRLRRRAYLLAGAFAIAIILAGVAVFFGNQANLSAAAAHASALNAQKNADEAQQNAAAAQENAQQAEIQRQIATSRELAASSVSNLDVDPERSILLALEAYRLSHTQEALVALHEAVLTSRIVTSSKVRGGAVSALAVSPDGRLYAGASRGPNVQLWETATGRERFLLTGQPPHWFSSVGFSPDGARLAAASGDEDGTVTIWDTSTGKEVLSIDLGVPANAVQFGPGGAWLVAGAFESQVRFWDASTGNELYALSSPEWTASNPPWRVLGETLSSDGTRLGVGLVNSRGCRLEIWNVSKRQRERILFEGELCGWLSPGDSLSPDGSKVAMVYTPDNEAASVWDVNTGRKLYDLGVQMISIVFSSDGRHLFTTSNDGRVQVWDAMTGNPLLTLVASNNRTQVTVADSPCPYHQAAEWCGTHLVTGSQDGSIKVWDITPDGPGEGLILPGADFVLDPDWSRLTTFNTSEDGFGAVATTIWKQAIPSWTQAESRWSVEQETYTWLYSPESLPRRIGVFNWLGLAPDGTMSIFDVRTPNHDPTTLCCFNVAKGGGLGPAGVSADGRTLVVTDTAGRAQFWDLISRRQMEVPTVNGMFRGLAFSPDGQRLAAADLSGEIMIWEIPSGRLLRTMPGQPQGGQPFFSPDGKQIAQGSCTGEIYVWDFATGKSGVRLRGHSACINTMAFSDDGNLLASSSSDGTTRVWDLASGREVLRLPVAGGSLARLAFSPDSRYLLASVAYAGGKDYETRIFLLNPDDLVALARSRVTRSLSTEECQQYLHTDICPPGP